MSLAVADQVEPQHRAAARTSATAASRSTRSSVLLPAPFEPRTRTASPRSTDRSTRTSAGVTPKTRVIPSQRNGRCDGRAGDDFRSAEQRVSGAEAHARHKAIARGAVTGPAGALRQQVRDPALGRPGGRACRRRPAGSPPPRPASPLAQTTQASPVARDLVEPAREVAHEQRRGFPRTCPRRSRPADGRPGRTARAPPWRLATDSSTLTSRIRRDGRPSARQASMPPARYPDTRRSRSGGAASAARSADASAGSGTTSDQRLRPGVNSQPTYAAERAAQLDVHRTRDVGLGERRAVARVHHPRAGRDQPLDLRGAERRHLGQPADHGAGRRG